MMNKVALIILLFCFGTAAAQPNYGWFTEGSNNKPTKRIRFSVSNPLDITLKNEGIIIKRTDLPFQDIAELWLAIIDPKLPSNPEPTAEELKKIGGYLMRKETNGHSIPLQVDDLDKDGIWNELFFWQTLHQKKPVTKDLSYEYMVFGGWSMGEVRNDESEFIEYVETERLKYNKPPLVKI